MIESKIINLVELLKDRNILGIRPGDEISTLTAQGKFKKWPSTEFRGGNLEAYCLDIPYYVDKEGVERVYYVVIRFDRSPEKSTRLSLGQLGEIELEMPRCELTFQKILKISKENLIEISNFDLDRKYFSYSDPGSSTFELFINGRSILSFHGEENSYIVPTKLFLFLAREAP